jgi:hypothetical protein
VAIWGRIQALVAGGAVATAASDGVRPVLEPVRQHAWTRNRQRVLDVDTTARLVAQAIIAMPDADDEAARNGYSLNRLQALVHLMQTMPGQSELARMLNRHTISPDLFSEALAKHQVDPRFWDALRDLTNEKLDPAQIAAGIHRGLLPDPGILLGEQPSGPRNVESYPVYPIDPLEEARADGFDRDRLGVLVGLQGLPMGPHEAAQAFFRGIITHGDYIAAFNESNNRNEWAKALLEQSRQIPTARDFFENALRGYHDFAWAVDQARRHGMSEADATVIYQNQGRPMNVRQITQALARGGKFNPEPGEIKDPYDAAIVEGNLKPAYYDLAKANRYTLPSPFVMKSLTQAGTWDAAKAEKRLLEAGWIPEDAAEAAADWAGGTASGADAHVGKAQTQLWTTLHRSYIAGESTKTAARPVLASLGLTTAAQDQVLALWDAERALVRKQLTPAQIKKAYTKGIKNQATGLTWTRDDALAALIERGYATTEANEFLDL